MIDSSSLTESEATVLAGYDAFGRGDMEALERLFLPDCAWTHRNAGRLGGTKHGFAAVLAFFADSVQASAGTLRVEPRSTLGRDSTVAVFVHMSGTRPDGRVLDDDQVHVFHLDGDRTARVDQYIGDPAGVEAFWT
jgi:ketosteroid isomerase-like protein